MAGDDQDGIGNLFKDRKLAVLLITAAAASILVTIYRLLSSCFFNRRQSDTITNHPRRHFSSPAALTPGSTDRILAPDHIPAHKYQGGDEEEDDGVCAVCLGELEEGEVVRTLPGCVHTFHAACIDVWLFSHVTCPVCRAEATPSPSPRVGPTRQLEVLLHN